MPAPLDLAYGRAPVLASFLAWSATHSWRSLGRFRAAREASPQLLLVWVWNEQASPGAPPKRAQSVRRRRGRSH